MRRLVQLSALTLVLLLGAACDRNVVYTEFERFDEATGWAKSHQPTFTYDNKDTSQLYDIYINVRNAESYPFRNLFMFLHTTDPKGVKTSDTIECVLADEKGKWLGSGIGDLYDNSIIYKKNTRFRHLGPYKFAYEQAMRYGDKNVIDPLPLILDVGITIEKSQD